MITQNREPKRRVLIADDDPVTRRLITSILENKQYKVVAVEDGRQAYRLLQTDSEFCGAILDMRMPHLEGLDLIRYMSSEKRLMRIPVMMVTSETDLQVLTNSFAAGIKVLLPKPFTIEKLQTMLDLLLKDGSQPAVVHSTNSLEIGKRRAS